MTETAKFSTHRNYVDLHKICGNFWQIIGVSLTRSPAVIWDKKNSCQVLCWVFGKKFNFVLLIFCVRSLVLVRPIPPWQSDLMWCLRLLSMHRRTGTFSGTKGSSDFSHSASQPHCAWALTKSTAVHTRANECQAPLPFLCVWWNRHSQCVLTPVLSLAQAKSFTPVWNQTKLIDNSSQERKEM